MTEKIYVFIDGTWLGLYIAKSCKIDDGKLTFITSHASDNIDILKKEMGIGTDKKHDSYRAMCPHGFELEWVDDFKTHPILKEFLGSD